MTLVISDLTSAKSMTALNPCQSKQICGGKVPFSFDFSFAWSSTKVNTTNQTGYSLGPSSVLIQGTDEANINVNLG